MGLDRTIDITAEQRKTVLALLERYLPNTTTWVYGSRAKWASRPQSDLDLVVFTTPEQNGRVSDLREAFEESTLPFRVDLFVWDTVPESFRKQIEADHVVLVGTDQDDRPEGKLRVPIQPAVPTLRSSGLDSKWSVDSVGDFFDLVTGYAFKSPDFCDDGIPVIKIKNVKAGHFNKHQFSYVSPDFLDTRSEKIALADDLLISMSGNRHDGSPETWVGKVALFREEDIYLINQRVGALRLKQNAGLDPRFASFLLSSHPYQELFISIATSSGGQANLSPKQILGAPVRYPEIGEQRAIAHILGTLDDKIELNRRMNKTLEAMARALFKSWFVDFDPVRAKMAGRETGLSQHLACLFPDRLVESELGEIPEGWEVSPLDEIAVFQNGLALQKYRPQVNEERLPVVKIAQLRSGKTDGGEWATSNIRPECIIDDGDVVFSWSGSLMVTVWCSGRAALNQHLFKVTSTRFPKWFFLHSVRSHLADFRTAAGKATTMGHIKRHHLSDAVCAVPDSRFLAAADGPLSAIFERSISANVQSLTLAAMRDSLLPKLVSGEIRLRENRQTSGATL